MALYGRTALAVGRCAVRLLNTAIQTQQLKKGLPSVIRLSWTSLGISGGLCAVPFVQDSISHEALIRRASSLVTDSANTFLSQTTLALVDSLTLYTKAMQTLITLHKQYVVNIQRLNAVDENTVWEVIVKQREKLVKYREDCKRFETFWMNANNVSQLAAEAAFNAGADQASISVQTNLQMAQSHVEQARQRSLEAELELKDSKAEFSQRLQSASSTVTESEEDIPEAYLRED